MTLVTHQTLALRDKAKKLNESFSGLAAEQMLDRLINGRVAGSLAVISSFGAEAAVLLKLVSDKDPSTPVVFLDTRRHFSETLRYVDDLMDQIGLTVLVRVRPRLQHIAAEDPEGDLAERDSDRCCYLRKTLPMVGVLRNYDCVLTGRKRFQTEARREMAYVEVQDSWLRANPLADWTREQLRDFLSDNGLLEHPLVKMGYQSIGCEPCTMASENYRDGRWAGDSKTECGIHFTADGKIQRGPSNE